MIQDLLPKERMKRIARAEDWEKAIELASQPLLDEGIIEKKYVQSMIKSVHDNGPYIVLKDYFALPHAKAGEHVNKLGMSLLALDEPVDLEGNPVKIFLVLAAVDSSLHLQALSELSELMMDEQNYKTFISGNLERIHDLLNK